MRKRNLRNKERGMALLIALLALFLISAIGLGMVYMSSGETSINQNYKDSQRAFFAMRGGLEEARDRLRSNATVAIPNLPTTQLPGTPGSIVYITNSSGAGDVVDPKNPANQYFDDELCHETVAGLAYSAPGTGAPCAAAPPAGSVVAYVPSISPYTGTASSLSYKWIRVTLKQNNTFLNSVVDSAQPLGSQVCWNSTTSQEVPVSKLGYADCLTAKKAGLQVGPVYIVTSLAVTPSGSRRIGQYETAAESITPPPGALSLDGPAPAPPATGIFDPAPNSNQYYVNGNDGSTPAGNPAPPSPPNSNGCTTNPAVSTPAIGTSATGVTSVLDPTVGIPSNRDSHYIGSTPTPSVVDDSASLTGLYSSPATLNTLVSTLASGADTTLNGCSMNGSGGSACVPPVTGLGTTASPQITFVNGDFNMGNSNGAGVLVVTGDLNVTGTGSFTGLVLIIGQGVMTVKGGGNGTFYGSVFIANTNDHNSPYSQLATLGYPSLQWSGGGGNGIYYNSCWADAINTMHYIVVASREEMY